MYDIGSVQLITQEIRVVYRARLKKILRPFPGEKNHLSLNFPFFVILNT